MTIYNDLPITFDDCLHDTYYCTPLSVQTLDYLKSLGATITEDHDKGKLPIFRYKLSFPNTPYGLSIIKGYGSIGREWDLFEVGVLYEGHLICTTDITDDVLGHLTEEDVCAIARLVLRLDDYGHIMPLKTSQKEQLA